MPVDPADANDARLLLLMLMMCGCSCWNCSKKCLECPADPADAHDARLLVLAFLRKCLVDPSDAHDECLLVWRSGLRAFLMLMKVRCGPY